MRFFGFLLFFVFLWLGVDSGDEVVVVVGRVGGWGGWGGDDVVGLMVGSSISTSCWLFMLGG